MKKRIFSAIICMAIIGSIFTSTVFAVKNTDDIVIIYENDVHCAVDGYSKISALKNELKQTYENVGVVSSGDYVQGTSLGAVSKKVSRDMGALRPFRHGSLKPYVGGNAP